MVVTPPTTVTNRPPAGRLRNKRLHLPATRLLWSAVTSRRPIRLRRRLRPFQWPVPSQRQPEAPRPVIRLPRVSPTRRRRCCWVPTTSSSERNSFTRSSCLWFQHVNEQIPESNGRENKETHWNKRKKNGNTNVVQRYFPRLWEVGTRRTLANSHTQTHTQKKLISPPLCWVML